MIARQLRYALNSAGYTTLSIENPHAAMDYNNNGNDRDFSDYTADVQSDNYAMPEAYARVRTAINHLASLGVEKVVIAGFSMGSRFATAHVARGQEDELPIVGLIGVGMNSTGIEPLNHLTVLDEVTVPLLDIYGDLDTRPADSRQAREDAYAGSQHDIYVATCNPDATEDDCHKLRNNAIKSANGDMCQPFENVVINWMTTNIPLDDPQGLGICADASAVSINNDTQNNTPSNGGDDGGGAGGYLLIGVLSGAWFRRWVVRRRSIGV